MKALLSVYDKSGLVDFASALTELGVELIASGGTAHTISDAGIDVTTVESLTGLPSLLGGRVKTLHPAIHAGILARTNDEDRAEVAAQGWPLIDLVVVNLYPFQQTIAEPDVTLAQSIEQIDIGGVALIRAAAKNFDRVASICDPADYPPVLEDIRQHRSVTAKTRHRLAGKAFQLTAAYDQAIAAYLTPSDDELPAQLSLDLPLTISLRYGENPHQSAAYYAPPGLGPLGGTLLQGKPLSYNNLLDLDAAWAAAEDFDQTTVVIVKHLSPCGIASANTIAEAFPDALASDPISAFGGVIAANRPFDAEAAQALGDLFVEAVAAPSFTTDALEVLSKRKNCRILRMDSLPPAAYNLRSVRGGLLAQTPDISPAESWQIVTDRQPTDAELASMRYAWQAVKHVKSNAIVLAQGQATVGIGGGLPSRVAAVSLAVTNAGDRAVGSAMASDAFFPFSDGVEKAAEAGVTAVVQPGGSIRDDDVITAANAHGMAMAFTGTRHFRH